MTPCGSVEGRSSALMMAATPKPANQADLPHGFWCHSSSRVDSLPFSRRRGSDSEWPTRVCHTDDSLLACLWHDERAVISSVSPRPRPFAGVRVGEALRPGPSARGPSSAGRVTILSHNVRKLLGRIDTFIDSDEEVSLLQEMDIIERDVPRATEPMEPEEML